jgi:nitrate/nitrite transporter NarK
VYVSLRHHLPQGEGGRARRGTVPRTVLLLGFTSLFTDVSSEMITAVLPIYLVLQLGLTPAQFGLVDGLYRGVSAVSRLAAGVASDWLGRPKLVASIGYGLSAATRPLLLVASSVGSVAGLISVDRIGKGSAPHPVTR